MAPFDPHNARQAKCLLAFAASEDGQNVVEYGLMIATIAMVVLLGTTAFGNNIRPWFEQLAARITTTGT
jgi:Flp pilus assembly pilin Flp